NVTVKKHTKVKHLEFELVYKEYVKKHNRIVSELLGPSVRHTFSELPKAVVVRADMNTGHWNRLPGIVCGFLYSLVTDRLFFIDGYDNFENYYEKDFDHDWKIVTNLYKDSTFRYIHSTNLYNDFSLVTRGSLNSDELISYDILYVRTWDYACAPITSNPYYKKWFNKTIPDYRVFTAISLKLLRLQLNISKQVETFADNNFNNYNIGIHLREKESPYDMIIPVEHYSQVVKMLMLEKKNMNISIFVAANNDSRKKLVKSLREIFSSNNNNSIKIVHIEQDMNSPNSVSWNASSEVRALVDMKLFSLCDDLVITYGSSFGFTAAGWSQKAFHQRGPFVVMPIKNSNDELWAIDKVWVWGAISREPCMYLSKLLIDKEDEET
ncbi:2461_t:CDS:1, partial [Cetraspora pellucida]